MAPGLPRAQMAAPSAAAWRARGATIGAVFAMPQVGQGPGTPAQCRWCRPRQQAPEVPLELLRGCYAVIDLGGGGPRPARCLLLTSLRPPHPWLPKFPCTKLDRS